MTSGVQVYTDLVVGHITHRDDFKQGDYTLVKLALGTFFLSFACLAILFNKARWTNRALKIEVAPFLTATLGVVAGCALFAPAKVKGLSILLIGLLILWLAISADRSRAEERGALMESAVEALALSFFCPYAVLLGIRTIMPAAVSDPSYWPLVANLPYWFCGITWLVYMAAHLRRKGSPPGAQSIWLELQPLAFLILIALARFPAIANGELFYRSPSAIGYAFWGLCSAFLLVCHVREARAYPGRMSTATMVAIAIAYHMRDPVLSILEGDDFHTGEMILPWHQIWEHGRAAYREFVSIQGLLGLTFGAFNSVFFDGTAATAPCAGRWMEAIVIGAGVASARHLLRPGAALFYLLFALPTTDRMYFAAASALLLVRPGILGSPLRWLILFGVIAPAAIFWHPSIGAAFVAGMAPIALVQAAKLYPQCLGRDEAARANRLGILVAGAAAALALVLFRDVALGLVNFIRQHGSSNTISYGLAFRDPSQAVPDWFQPAWAWFGDVRIPWEVARFGPWVLSTVALTYVFVRELGAPSKFDLRPSRALPIAGILFGMVLVPYSVGRIDSMSYSRVGQVGFVLAGTFLLPSLALRAIGGRSAPLLAWLVVGLGLSYVPPDVSVFKSQLLHLPKVASGFVRAPLVSRTLNGSWVEPANSKRLLDLKAALDKALHQDESYVDLTNRSILYYALDKVVPVPYSAHYLYDNEALQGRVISALEENAPAAALVSPLIPLDGTASLRAYRVYRWFLERGYQFLGIGNFGFLLSPSRFQELTGRSKNTEAENLEKRAVFNPDDLHSVPASWGKNWSRLSERFEASGRPREFDESSSTRLPSLKKSKLPPDFLLINFEARCECAPEEAARFRILWRSAHDSPVVTGPAFKLKNTTALVPVGTDPAWFDDERSPRRLYLQNERDNTPACFCLVPKDVTPLRLVR